MYTYLITSPLKIHSHTHTYTQTVASHAHTNCKLQPNISRTLQSQINKVFEAIPEYLYEAPDVLANISRVFAGNSVHYATNCRTEQNVYLLV